MASSPIVNAETIDELLDRFTRKISKVLEFKSATMSKIAFKSNCRKAPGRQKKVQVHFDLYRQCLFYFNKELVKATQHFSEIKRNNTHTICCG